MKIEFDLKMQDAALMIDALRKVAYDSNSAKVRTVLENIINEIESDSQMAHLILGEIRRHFHTNNLTSNKIFPESNMEYGLGISKPYLLESRGLTRTANIILTSALKKFKPKTNLSKVKKISNPSIKKCVVVHDVIILIQTAYESA